MFVVPRIEIRQLSEAWAWANDSGICSSDGSTWLSTRNGPQSSSPTMMGRIVAPMFSAQPAAIGEVDVDVPVDRLHGRAGQDAVHALPLMVSFPGPPTVVLAPGPFLPGRRDRSATRGLPVDEIRPDVSRPDDR